MASKPSAALRHTFTRLFSEPLSLSETAGVALILFVGGTIYCQFYCLIAFQQMHGMAMPLTLSMKRSAVETIPAITAFELAKRALSEQTRSRRLARICGSFALVAAVTVAALATLRLTVSASAMPIRLIVADRLPGLILTAIAVFWASKQSQMRASTDAYRNDDATQAVLPPSERVDWVQAAGNYVEVHFGGRTSMFRMTLRQALWALGPDAFVQVHRSLLVNRGRIRSVDQRDRHHVRLEDGTLLKVGETYRSRIFDE